MTVVLCDSIQAKPLPIARAIIRMRWTRLVTTIGKTENSYLCEITHLDSGKTTEWSGCLKRESRPAMVASVFSHKFQAVLHSHLVVAPSA